MAGMSRRQRTTLLGVVLALCLGAIALEAQTKAVRRLYDNWILDNRGHYLPCDRLPGEAEVRLVLQQHADTVQAIERVNPGLVGADMDTSTCPGKADLVIWYASHPNRLAIEKIIGSDTFFGIPYRLENR